MVDPAGSRTPLPMAALAPAAAVLNPRALGSAGNLLPGTILPQTVQTAPPAPDTSVFDEQWFGSNLPGKAPENAIFRDILAGHNANLQRFADWRALILATAEVELAEGTAASTNLLETISQLLSAVYSHDPPRRDFAPLSRQEIRDRLFAPLAKGFGGVFDPWAAWWAGVFRSGGDAHNVHIWEPECSVIRDDGTVQSVQAVTQVETPVDSRKPEGTRWFLSANRLITEPDSFAQANYAINVWSADDHITGYVWKHVTAGSTKPVYRNPHIGFLLAPDTLLWLATIEPADTVFGGKARELHIFVEWGIPQPDYSGTYNIRGTYMFGGVEWLASGLSFTPNFLLPGGSIKFGQCGYRQCAPFKGRGDFKRAEALGLLLNTDRVAITSAKAI